MLTHFNAKYVNTHTMYNETVTIIAIFADCWIYILNVHDPKSCKYKSIIQIYRKLLFIVVMNYLENSDLQFRIILGKI